MFSQNSFFIDAPETNRVFDLEPKQFGHNVRIAQDLALAQLRDDWAHRLKQAADEAGDGGLLALESDLLDLRDEILLH